MLLKYISDKEELLDTRISQNLDTSYLRLLDSTKAPVASCGRFGHTQQIGIF